MSAGEIIRDAVSAWPGITTSSHRFGGIEYRLGERQIGHVHGDRLVDIPFPTAVRKEIVAAGEAEPHHVLPDSGWVSFRIRKAADTDAAIALLRRSYDLITAQLERRAAQSARVKAERATRP